MGVRHPQDRSTDIVMTTDLIVDVHDSLGARTIAISVKGSADLSDERTLTKLEIERRYWASLAVPWKLITEKQVSESRTLQLLWVHEWYWLDHLEVPHEGFWERRCQTLLSNLQSKKTGRLSDFIFELETIEGFSPGEALSAIRHLVAHKRISIDLNRPIDMRGPLSQLILPSTFSDVQRSAA